MARSRYSAARYGTPDPDATTQAFTAADVAELRALITKQGDVTAAAAKALSARPRHARTVPPNLGSGLTVVLVVTILALCSVAVVFGWLILSH